MAPANETRPIYTCYAEPAKDSDSLVIRALRDMMREEIVALKGKKD